MPDEARDGQNIALIDKCIMVCLIVQRRIKLLCLVCLWTYRYALSWHLWKVLMLPSIVEKFWRNRGPKNRSKSQCGDPGRVWFASRGHRSIDNCALLRFHVVNLYWAFHCWVRKANISFPERRFMPYNSAQECPVQFRNIEYLDHIIILLNLLFFIWYLSSPKATWRSCANITGPPCLAKNSCVFRNMV